MVEVAVLGCFTDGLDALGRTFEGRLPVFSAEAKAAGVYFVEQVENGWG